MKSIAILSVAAEQGNCVVRVKWKPPCEAGFEIISPTDLQSQTEPVSVCYHPIPKHTTGYAFRKTLRKTGKPSPSQRCILPRSNDRRHIHVYLHTHVSANRDQYVLQHSLVPALALAAQMAGGGMSVWGKEGAGPAIAPRQMFSSLLGDTALRKPIQGCWSRIAGSVPCSSLCPHGHLRFILFHL